MAPDVPAPEWPPVAADERTILTGYLEAYRAIMVRKARGLGAAQLAVRWRPRR